MKANFKIKKTGKKNYKERIKKSKENNEDLTQEEFEEYLIKSGVKGSFMVYRSKKKDDELGLDQL